jgi:hypothetical protein
MYIFWLPPSPRKDHNGTYDIRYKLPVKYQIQMNTQDYNTQPIVHKVYGRGRKQSGSGIPFGQIRRWSILNNAIVKERERERSNAPKSQASSTSDAGQHRIS